MKSRLKNRITSSALCLATALTVVACSDWTEVESVGVNNPNIAVQNPELYAQYLENLRSYKNSDHQATYVWFDNSIKTPFSRAHHLTDLPDSIDAVVLMHPENLVAYELKEMESIRREKGTKILAATDYDAMKLEYDMMVAEKLTKDPTYVPELFLDVMISQVKSLFQNVDKYGYDGISIGFKGKGTLHLTGEELKEYTNNGNLFIGMMTDWHERRKEKIFVFEGKPQNLIDKSILAACQLILLPSESATSRDQFTYQVAMAKVAGVPTDRFAVSVSTTSLDETDTKTGYLSDRTRALTSAAQWSIVTYNNYTVAGLGIYNVSNDYYNTSLVYKYTRDAITTLNPSIKN